MSVLKTQWGRVFPNLKAAVPPINKVTAPWTAPHFRVPMVSIFPPPNSPNQSRIPYAAALFWTEPWALRCTVYLGNGYTPTASMRCQQLPGDPSANDCPFGCLRCRWASILISGNQ